jgi:protease-4
LGAQTYDEFLKMVAVNREMTREELLPLAEGRIWSGKAASKNKLVDESGGLTAAIQRAADMAGIGDLFTVIERPELLTIEQQIEKLIMGVSANPPKTQSSLQLMTRALKLEINRLGSLNDPYGQYMILPYSLKIN